MKFRKQQIFYTFFAAEMYPDTVKVIGSQCYVLNGLKNTGRAPFNSEMNTSSKHWHFKYLAPVDVRKNSPQQTDYFAPDIKICSNYSCPNPQI